MPAAADKIWLPGLGVTDVQAARVDKAVNEYDHTLRFGRNEDSGQWCVFMIKRGDKPLPVSGWDEIPHPDDAIKRLYRCDSVRHGRELLDAMERENTELRRPINDKVDWATCELAEHIEHFNRSLGKTRYGRVHLGRTNKKMGGWL